LIFLDSFVSFFICFCSHQIADEAIKDIQSLVAERYGKNFTSDSPRKYFKKVKNAQEAHEAIRPTDIRRLPSTIASLLDADSLKLYTLIWSRAVACQMEPASIAQVIYVLFFTLNHA
jgi:DNA topoisomerase IA